IEEATGRRKTEIEVLLARRFGIVGSATGTSITPIASEVQWTLPEQTGAAHASLDRESDEGAPEHLPDLQSATATASPERYRLQVTIAKSTREKMDYARGLLSHAVPNGDVAQVLDRAFDALITQLEKRKAGATTRPRG